MNKLPKTDCILFLLLFSLFGLLINIFPSITLADEQNFTNTTKTKYKPMQITSQITDPNNLLTADKPQVLASFNKAQNNSGIRIYCVFVPDFTNPSQADP
ncbi:MAG: hypothetical protein LBT99_00980, partial [Bifidobacteriaceae bacterium]|nr:hypothetical protein [Bifidobacteriaceae bacterium]